MWPVIGFMAGVVITAAVGYALLIRWLNGQW